MNNPIVLKSNRLRSSKIRAPRRLPVPQVGQHIDPLSEVLALLRPQSYSSGGFGLPPDVAIHFPKHKGVKCYAVLTGQCWLLVDGAADAVLLNAGDCFLLPHGLPLQLAADPTLKPLHYKLAWARMGIAQQGIDTPDGKTTYMAGGHFALTGIHAEMLLQSLPPIVHIRRDQDKIALRWSLELMREELRDPQPGGSLIMQQLAYMMLVRALRLHMTDTGSGAHGWLSALSDRHMRLAITNMHQAPGHPWTLKSIAESAGLSRSVFALRFREMVGTSPIEYLTRWRMLLAADRLKNSPDNLCVIAQSLGYDSQGAFGKAFRRIMGCSPRKYTRTSQKPEAPAAARSGDGRMAASTL